jgi:hypothetical protein
MKKVVVRIMMKDLEIKELSLPVCRAESYVQVMKQKGFDCQILR